MNKFFESPYSIEDLEKFRDKDGFIDLTKIGIEFSDDTREERGNPNRIKNWVSFKGKKALIKGEEILDQEQTYGIYGELIVEELAKKLEIKTAHYDLVKFLDENGNSVFGVLSESFIDDQKEKLVNLEELIAENLDDGEYADGTSYEFTVKELRKRLELEEYEEINIEKVIDDYKKRMLFTLMIVDLDKHIENIIFITRVCNGKKEIELSPNFDSESAFMLDNYVSTIDMLLENNQELFERVRFANPLICVFENIENRDYKAFWIDTLRYLIKEDKMYDYYHELVNKNINFDEILSNVEKRIKAPLPEKVKLLSKYVYQARNQDIKNVIIGEMQIKNQQERTDKGKMLLDMLIQSGTSNITISELISIGKALEEDIEKNKESIETEDNLKF